MYEYARGFRQETSARRAASSPPVAGHTRDRSFITLGEFRPAPVYCRFTIFIAVKSNARPLDKTVECRAILLLFFSTCARCLMLSYEARFSPVHDALKSAIFPHAAISESRPVTSEAIAKNVSKNDLNITRRCYIIQADCRFAPATPYIK